MPDSFDPYQEWLEISDPTRPLDHYTLLGLDRKENDPGVIAHAADTLMAKLRKIRPGPRVADWGRLLDQLSGAKVCLLDPSSKATYDASLATDQPPAPQEPAAFTPGPPPPTVPTGMENRTAPDPMAPPETPPQPPAQSVTPPRASTGPAASQGWVSAPQTLKMPTQGDLGPDGSMGTLPPADAQASIVAPMPVGGHIPQEEPPRSRITTMLSLVLLLLAGCLAVYAVGKFRQPMPVVQNEPEKTVSNDASVPGEPDVPDSPEPPKPPEQPPVEQQPPEKPPSTPQPPVEPPTAPVDPPPGNPPPNPDPPPRVHPPVRQIDRQKQATFVKAISQARAAMAGHDAEAAQRHLDAAQRSAQTSQEEDRVARLRLMRAYLGQFWELMSRSVAGLEAGIELGAMNTRVVVVESSDQHLVIRASGQNRRYAIKDIPSVLVLSIVEECFLDDPGTKALIGTFLAIDPDGDPKRARQYWQEATEGGVDVEQLMPELEARTSAGG